MTESRKLQILRLEFANGNFQRAYELADDLIISSTADSEIGLGWLYKGLSAGCLSSIAKERLVEAVSLFREAQKHHLDSEERLVGGKSLSKIVLNHVIRLSKYYSDSLDSRIENQRGRVDHRPGADISEYAGREIGQALFDGVMSGERWRKGSVELGHHFEKNHSSAIVTTFDYAFELTSGSAEVSQNVAKAIEIIIGTSSITPMARRRFRAAISPLVEKIWALYPTTTFHYLKDSDELTCPNCGYTIVQIEKPERGCLFIGIMSIVTLGIYFFIYLVDSVLLGNKEVVKTANKGQRLICVTCGHQWTY